MSRRALYVALAVVCLFNFVIVYTFLVSEPKTLTVSFLDVGQGDAILIQSPTGTDVLIDGGRNGAALRELGKVLGPLDRTIDLVIETHPDADHIGGLPAVFDAYTVRGFVEPGITNDTSPTKALIVSAEEEQAAHLYARRGDRISLGGGAYLDILFPDRDVSGLETNTGSIVARLSYGDTSFMFTGDSPSSIEQWLVYLDGTELKSDVLKAGHHGSRTSTDDVWLAAVLPSAVVISAGKDNTYGHPHEETIGRIQKKGARIFSTAESGTLTFTSNGKEVRIR